MSILISFFTEGALLGAPTAISVPTDGRIMLDALMAQMPVSDDMPSTLTVSIAPEGDEACTIIDRCATGIPLTVSIEAAHPAPIEYHWLPSEADGNHPRVARTVLAHCNGTGSTVTVRCFRQTSGGQLVNLATEQVHRASHTSSRVQIHGVSSDTSRMNVESLIHIEENICGIKAHQIHKHLLLNQGARATSEPMLEVLSDDVTCSHGSAIRYLDENQLFYLQSRGYEPDQARKELVKAFLTA